jgi:broad specificity phosphatase PhoE
MTTVFLARHGQTDWNHRYSGSSDIPLNSTGEDQARRLAERLRRERIEAVYSSPLKRALRTAEIIGAALRVPVTADPGFREIHYGQWEGLTIPEILSGYGDIRAEWERDPAAVKPPGGETGIEVAERALAALGRILREHAHERFLIVAHKTIHRLILAASLGIDLTEYRRRFSLDNAGLSALEHREGGFILLLHNDTSHLTDLIPNRRKVKQGARE